MELDLNLHGDALFLLTGRGSYAITVTTKRKTHWRDTMTTTYSYSDNETTNEFTLVFNGMPNVKEVNLAGTTKFGSKFLSMTLTSVTTS